MLVLNITSKIKMIDVKCCSRGVKQQSLAN